MQPPTNWELPACIATCCPACDVKDQRGLLGGSQSEQHATILQQCRLVHLDGGRALVTGRAYIFQLGVLLNIF
jgi:hypothetical protein